MGEAHNIVPLVAREDFFSIYFSFIGKTESPRIYNRWMAISMVGALLSRQTWIPFGHSTIYPNQYIWLVGVPGARKGTAIGPIKNLLRSLKYEKTSPQRISPEMFLAQLQRINTPKNIQLLNEIEIEEMEFNSPCEMYVISDELADFIRGNTDFVKVITNLYDCLPFYDHPKLHGKSVYVHEPTLNITGGITPEDITLSVPPETMGQGFFSRLILVYSEPTTIRITIPEAPSNEAMARMVERLKAIMQHVKGPMEIPSESHELLTTIYNRFPGINSANFQHYNSRRFTHLLKLSIVMAAMDIKTRILPEHVLQANTILHSAETRMPKALGEFGRARHASITHKIVEVLKASPKPLALKDLWFHVVNDLNKLEDLITIIKGLEYAEKIQRITIDGRTGFLPLHKEDSKWYKGLVVEDEGFLFPEESIA
jgi:hypothetical protein